MIATILKLFSYVTREWHHSPPVPTHPALAFQSPVYAFFFGFSLSYFFLGFGWIALSDSEEVGN